MTPLKNAVAADIERFLSLIWLPGEVRELRCPQYNTQGQTASGYFDSPAALAKAAAGWDGIANSYFTLNPVKPDLLARAPNRVDGHARNTTADCDVLRRHWLFLDVDPSRPPRCSSTDSEREAALATLTAVTRALSDAGWPDPATALSGNGYYALYRIDLDNNPETTGLVKAVLESLATRFDTAAAHIDPTVYNASRIAAIIGTLKVKGEPTPDRPHRRSQIVSAPESLSVVSEDLLLSVAQSGPPTAEKKRHSTFIGSIPADSLRDILDRHGIEYKEQPPDAQGVTWYHVRQCPFHNDGDDFECGVGQKLPDGPYAGKCFHPEGTGKGWREWKATLGLQIRHAPMLPVASGDGAPEAAAKFPLTEVGNAELFAWLYGDRVRFDHARQRWLLWNEHRWEEDADGEVYRLAKESTRLRYRAAEHVDSAEDRKRISAFAISSESRQRVESTLALARRERPIADAGTQWDQAPWLLGVNNGVVDLRTGTLRPGLPEDRITMHVPVDYHAEATAERWDAFLDEVFRGDQELLSFIQRATGYSMTGVTSEQVLFLCYGNGSNGKSVFLTVLRWLAGGYAMNIPFTVLELAQRAAITNDLASLAGRRLVTSSETNESTRLNEARIKALTGGDPITARFLYQEAFTFLPSAKFWLSVNHLPEVKDDSHGFWRRVRVIPFLREFSDEEADQNLADKLHGELAGILAWAIRGALEWQRTRLRPPASVSSATESYRQESDDVSRFIGDCCVVADDARAAPKELYVAYEQWAEREGIPTKQRRTANAFGRRMGARFARGKSSGDRLYRGIGLLAEDRVE